VHFQVEAGVTYNIANSVNSPTLIFQKNLFITNSGSLNWYPGSGAIVLSGGGTDTQTLDFHGLSVDKIVVNDTDGGVKQLAGNVTAAGLTVTAGTLDLNGASWSMTQLTGSGSIVLGGATLTLVVSPLLVAALALTAILAALVVIDGESTWLEGMALIGLYVILAASVWWGAPIG
jgi:hypothetical protein